MAKWWFAMYPLCITKRVGCLFQELLKKCHQCMETIVKAKDQQAAEANKNASILLKELDLEKVSPDKTSVYSLASGVFPKNKGRQSVLILLASALCGLTVQRGEQEASSCCEAGEAQGEAQEEEGGAEEEAGGRGGAEDEGGVL